MNPANYFRDAGFTPDAWQEEILSSNAVRKMLLITRQGGKSLVSAALALKEAFETPDSLILLLSPTQRQSGELFKAKVMRLYNRLARPVPSVRPKDNATMLELVNGSRIISLPGDEETIRGYSEVRLLVVDEASRVSDGLYQAVRPMLAVSKGKMVALSTPFGKRGWFYEAWTRDKDWSEEDGHYSVASWQKVRLRANQCPRITLEWLEEERRAIGDLWFDQEYGTEFVDTIAGLYRQSDIDALPDPSERGATSIEEYLSGCK